MSTIGFDTSNYTTSTAWTDGKTDINVRQILYVKDGERGIRQSDGVFQHMKLMPVMYEKLSEQIDFKDVKGQDKLIEAVVLAAAGGHNMLMVGEPG